jgi:hypothetical protein
MFQTLNHINATGMGTENKNVRYLKLKLILKYKTETVTETENVASKRTVNVEFFSELKTTYLTFIQHFSRVDHAKACLLVESAALKKL